MLNEIQIGIINNYLKNKRTEDEDMAAKPLSSAKNKNSFSAKPIKKIKPLKNQDSSLEERFDPDIIQEEFPTNVMGTSSSTSGTGPIDTFDPKLKIKGKNFIAKRKTVGFLGSAKTIT